jgi:hypothetical protein
MSNENSWNYQSVDGGLMVTINACFVIPDEMLNQTLNDARQRRYSASTIENSISADMIIASIHENALVDFAEAVSQQLGK